MRRAPSSRSTASCSAKRASSPSKRCSISSRSSIRVPRNSRRVKLSRRRRHPRRLHARHARPWRQPQPRAARRPARPARQCGDDRGRQYDPAAAISDVEVISGGAAATYGPDAMAGVVNFELRRDFEGIDINYQTGTTEAGDGEETRFDVLMGGNFAENRGNAMFSVGYANREPAWQMNRDFFVDGFNDPGTPANYPRIDYPITRRRRRTCRTKPSSIRCWRHGEPVAHRRFLYQPARRHRVSATERSRLHRPDDVPVQVPHQRQPRGGQPAFLCFDPADTLLLVWP